jgi:hypothetical protein
MIGINQLRWVSAQPRVAQPHRQISFSIFAPLLTVYGNAV